MLRVRRDFADKAMRKAMVLKPLMFGADDWAEAVAAVDGGRPRYWVAGQDAVEELIVEVAKSLAKELGSKEPFMVASVEAGEAN